MKVLDRYIARTYLSTFLIVLCFVLGIYLIISIFAFFDTLFEAKEALAARGLSSLEFALRYYAADLPFVLMRVLPIITFIAATIVFIRLSRGNEIQPMISSGRSPDRIALPVYVFAGLVMLGMLAAQEWLAPRLADERIRLKWIAAGDDGGEVDDIPPMLDSAGNTWSIELYYPLPRRIEHLEVIRFKSPVDGECMGIRCGKGDYLGTLAAKEATWREDGARGTGWYPVDGILLPAEDSPDFGRLVELPPDEPLATDLTPVAIDLELSRSSREAGRMLSISQAARLAEEFPDLPRQRVALHTLLTWPVANLLLVMLGLPFIFRLGERSLFVGVGVAILVCAAYFAVDAVFRSLGSRNVMAPSFAVWLPVAFFLAFTIAIRSALRI